MKEIPLHLFRLYNKEDGSKGQIVAKGEDLKAEIEELISSIEDTGMSKTQLVKHLVKRLNISITTAERLVYLERSCPYIRRIWFPLVYIQELLSLSPEKHYEIQNKIEFLKINNSASFPIKAVRHLTEDLCKIAGAHAADGTLHKGKDYGTYIAVVDQHKNSIEAIARWFKDAFGIELKVKSSPNKKMWQVAFRNKIIGRYLNKIFGFNYGSKTYDVEEPEIIKNAPMRYRRAFALGFLTFEGGVGIKNQIELTTRSERMRDSIYQILVNNEIDVRKKDRLDSRQMWRLWSTALSKKEAEGWLHFFEAGTEKWSKLYEYINGFQGKVDNFEDAKKAFCSVFPFQSASKTSIEEILDIVMKDKETWRYAIQDKIEGMESKWAHSVAHYVRILERANAIRIEKRKFGKKRSFGSIIRDVYIYNPNISSWRVPYRPWLEDEINYLN